MSVHRRFLSILAGVVSKFEMMPPGPTVLLTELRRDKDAARREIQEVLDRYAGKHDIAPDEARRVSQAYVDAVVDSLFLDREAELDREIERAPGLYWAMSCAVT